MEQIRRNQQAHVSDPEEAVQVHPVDGPAVEDVDELLDEIDEVLEENAEDFVRGYIQKGGE